MKELKTIDQLHRSVPQSMTQENLARWITENQKNVIHHITRLPLTPEEVSDYEHKSSLASRALDRLKAVEEEFKHYLKKGTQIDPANAEDFLPMDITIPPTKGTDALKANRQFADDILEKGYTETTTDVYLIPYPEEQMMVAVTIEGHECPDYTKPMTEDEKVMYGNLFVKDKNGEMRAIDNADMEVNGDGTARIKTPRKKSQPFI